MHRKVAMTVSPTISPSSKISQLLMYLLCKQLYVNIYCHYLFSEPLESTLLTWCTFTSKSRLQKTLPYEWLHCGFILGCQHWLKILLRSDAVFFLSLSHQERMTLTHPLLFLLTLITCSELVSGGIYTGRKACHFLLSNWGSILCKDLY